MQPLRKRRGFRTQCPSHFTEMPQAQELSVGCHPAFLGGSIAGLALVFVLTSFTRPSCSGRNAPLDFQRANAWAWFSPFASATPSLAQPETGFLRVVNDVVSARET